MMIKPWDVWYAAVRFEDSEQVKSRPVVVTSSGIAFILAFKVTSHMPRNEWGEYALIEWQYAGLRKPSTVRIGKPLQLATSDMTRRLGSLHPLDVVNIQKIVAGQR